MKPIDLIAAAALFIFGLMEMLRDHYSSLGFILIIAGLAMLVVQITRRRVDRMEAGGEQIADRFHPIETPLPRKPDGKESDTTASPTGATDA